MRISCKKNEFGMTIVELIVVLAIVFFVSAFAIMQVNSSKESLKMQNVAVEFKSYLERARFDSVKRNTSDINAMAKVTINSPTSFTTATDFNQNGTLEAGESRTIDFSYQDEVVFFSENVAFPVLVSFNKRGHSSAIDGNGNSINPRFLICQKKCANIARMPENFQIVAVTPTGTATILNGDEMLSLPQTPKNITTSTSDGIDPLTSTVSSDGSIPIIRKLKKKQKKVLPNL